MQKLVLGMFLILLLVPLSQSYSEEKSDTLPTLSVSLTSETPFVYQDSEGYTVVVGAVENNDSLSSVTNVLIQVKFYDDLDPIPLEVIQGHTTLKVIPANGKSPYAIRSQTPDPNITQASVSLLGFDPSEDKQKGLSVYSSEIFLDTSLRFSGVLQNGGAPNTDANVYLAFYDGFEPPRILGVSAIELGNVEPNTEVPFEINEEIDPRSVGFLLFAESNIFNSNFVDVKIPAPQSMTKLVSISNVSVKDTNGNSLSEIKLGSTVNIESKTLVEFSGKQIPAETPYTYYVQIKESGEPPYVEFIGKFDGRFIGNGPQSQSIDWIPEKKGLFFIETFVWDRNNIPISEQGPFVLILIN
ncbi:hypothetical protein [Nitrosopumilus ureiphilus]|uniref:Uncharacterized protein n=1 Tax=Nitrosopumilus ureiphilus TaxID=1470067 RepID=A0A7D5RF55_9ARCH|nr:hypothetical protein [Nitrosopumilus ureiphilus]QLH07543.1 hypothetical protein C5F50_11040 [Nitrosopumilus ureiphilus]